MLLLSVQERVIHEDSEGSGGLKIIYFVRRNEATAPDDFITLWDKVNDLILGRNPTRGASLPKFARNDVVRNPGTTVPYDTVSMMWSKDLSDTGLFLRYREEMDEYSSAKSKFVDVSRSFFAFTEEFVFYPTAVGGARGRKE